jgi:hypothetical protein
MARDFPETIHIRLRAEELRTPRAIARGLLGVSCSPTDPPPPVLPNTVTKRRPPARESADLRIILRASGTPLVWFKWRGWI